MYVRKWKEKFMEDLANKKRNLRCHGDQTYEIIYLICCMLIFLLQSSMLARVKSSSQKVLEIKKGICVAIVTKFMKIFILIVTCQTI